MTAPVAASSHVDAPAHVVYDLLADLPRMGEWSPECVRCEWLGGATAAAVGARFKGHNRNGARRWTTTGEVVVADPGRELTFDVASLFGLPVARWRYRIEASPDGTACEVTESTEDRRGRFMRALAPLATGVRRRDPHNLDGMQRTLQRLRAAAESTSR